MKLLNEVAVSFH